MIDSFVHTLSFVNRCVVILQVLNLIDLHFVELFTRGGGGGGI